MSMFRDHDPEDAWDAADPVQVKLDVLVRWVASILVEHAYDGATPRVHVRAGDALDAIAELDGLDLLTEQQTALLAVLTVALRTVPRA